MAAEAATEAAALTEVVERAGPPQHPQHPEHEQLDRRRRLARSVSGVA